jgi:hypothetical protein
MTSFWREWIVNYDFAHQRSLGEEGARQGRALIDDLRRRVMTQYQALLRAAHAAGRRADQRSLTWLRGAAVLLFLLMLLGNATRIRGWGQSLTWRRRPASAPRQSAALWYGRMTQALGKRGWRKAPEQTAAEFVGKIADAGVRQSVDRFTRHYERARFAESGEDAELLPKLYDDISAQARQTRD